MRAFGRDNLVEACAGLLGAKQRSALALVGILMGVASVSAMISLSGIAREEAARQFQELGTDIATVALRTRDRRAGRVGLTLPDAEDIVTLPAIAEAAPYVVDNVPVVLEGKTSLKGKMIGATDALADLSRLTLAQGRFVSALDAGRYYCTIGSEIAEALRPLAPGGVIGATIRVRQAIFTVVGELAPAGRGQRPFDPDEVVFVPVETVSRISPDARLRDIQVRLSPQTHHSEARRQVEDWSAIRVPSARVRVRSPEELIEQMHRQRRLYTLLLGAVGAISLLVGGIGVMNVMLVALSERTVEIGVRRALGARRRDIQAQFLTEALILALIGGLFGVLAGMAATYGICRFTGWQYSLSVGGTLLGAAVAGGAGVFFGLYPAHQAARLNPVNALKGT